MRTLTIQDEFWQIDGGATLPQLEELEVARIPVRGGWKMVGRGKKLEILMAAATFNNRDRRLN